MEVSGQLHAPAVLPPSPGGKCGARGSVVGSGTILHVGRWRVRFPMSLDFSFDLPAAL
jgi:hypothetical protein